MTPQETAKYQASVMIAFAEGKSIEYVRKGYTGWSSSGAPLWNWCQFNYRVKPAEPKKVKYLCYVCNGQLFWWKEDDYSTNSSWKRVPSEDKIIEME